MRAALVLALTGLLSGVASCTGDEEPSQAATSRPASSPPEDGCARVVSAIGWAEFLLVEPGREERQDFESGVRGRLAYVEGTVTLFGEHLPPEAVAPADRLRRLAHSVVDLGSTRAERVQGLRAYRRAVRDVEQACGQTVSGGA